MAHGKTIKLFLIEGDMDGLIQASISGRICIGYKIPREKISNCKEIKDLNQTGVYFLFGNEEVYVGQAAQRKNGLGLSQRLIEHDNTKESYWTDAVALTATDDSLNPMMIWYLENWFYERAKTVGTYKLHNANTPNPGKVTMAEEAALQDYVEDALMLVKALGYRTFEKDNKSTAPVPDGVKVTLDSRDAHANGIYTSDKRIIVLKGSTISGATSPSYPASMHKKRKDLLSDGTIVENKFVKNSKPEAVSTAASIVLGRSANGWTLWRMSDGEVIDKLRKQSVNLT